MRFINSGLLWIFLPLAAIPIVLHLLTLHRLKTVELSTFRFLFDSYVQQRRPSGRAAGSVSVGIGRCD